MIIHFNFCKMFKEYPIFQTLFIYLLLSFTIRSHESFHNVYLYRSGVPQTSKQEQLASVQQRRPECTRISLSWQIEKKSN